MKVELNRPTLDSLTPSQTSAAGVSADQSVQTPEVDTATLSTDKASVEALTAKALTSPEIRQEKVDALRQAIKSGQYNLGPDDIAEAMIRESQ
jgi:flagellar biosynthesis anti-sigma factor FlgM